MANTKLHKGDLVGPLSDRLTTYIKSVESSARWQAIRERILLTRSSASCIDPDIEPKFKKCIGLVIEVKRQRGIIPVGRGGRHVKKPGNRMSQIIYVRWFSGILAGKIHPHHQHDLSVISKASRK